MEWIFLSTVFIGYIVYEIVERYFEYKEVECFYKNNVEEEDKQ